MEKDKQTRVIKFNQTGAADVLELGVEDIRIPDEGEIRIKVEVIGLNRAEVMFRQGQYLEEPQFPSRLGYEAAGIVDAVGPGTENLFAVGDRVSTIPAFSMGEYGVYGESAIVPVHAVAKYPDNLSPQQGTSIWMQYITAYGALIELGGLQKKDAVVVTAASSSVGLAAIQIANAIGATTIAVTRSAVKKAMLQEAGAEHVIVTDEMDLAQSVMEITGGKGARILFDPIGGPVVNDLADAAAQNGIIFEYGALSPDPTPFPLFPALAKNLTIRGYVLFEIVQNPETLERAKTFIYDNFKNGKLSPQLDKKQFKFENIVQAHEYMESNQQVGKIVVNL